MKGPSAGSDILSVIERALGELADRGSQEFRLAKATILGRLPGFRIEERNFFSQRGYFPQRAVDEHCRAAIAMLQVLADPVRIISRDLRVLAIQGLRMVGPVDQRGDGSAIGSAYRLQNKQEGIFDVGRPVHALKLR